MKYLAKYFALCFARLCSFAHRTKGRIHHVGLTHAWINRAISWHDNKHFVTCFSTSELTRVTPIQAEYHDGKNSRIMLFQIIECSLLFWCLSLFKCFHKLWCTASSFWSKHSYSEILVFCHSLFSSPRTSCSFKLLAKKYCRRRNYVCTIVHCVYFVLMRLSSAIIRSIKFATNSETQTQNCIVISSKCKDTPKIAFIFIMQQL